MIDVHDEPLRHRFVLTIDGDEVASAAYAVSDGTRTLTHTVVDPRFGGQGIGQRLAQEVLDRARRNGERIDPQCSFIRSYIDRHPQYRDLVDRPPGAAAPIAADQQEAAP